jgi:hypothetical protein
MDFMHHILFKSLLNYLNRTGSDIQSEKHLLPSVSGTIMKQMGKVFRTFMQLITKPRFTG